MDPLLQDPSWDVNFLAFCHIKTNKVKQTHKGGPPAPSPILRCQQCFFLSLAEPLRSWANQPCIHILTYKNQKTSELWDFERFLEKRTLHGWPLEFWHIETNKQTVGFWEIFRETNLALITSGSSCRGSGKTRLFVRSNDMNCLDGIVSIYIPYNAPNVRDLWERRIKYFIEFKHCNCEEKSLSFHLWWLTHFCTRCEETTFSILQMTFSQGPVLSNFYPKFLSLVGLSSH